MTTRVVSVTAAAAPGLTVTVDGRAHLVLAPAAAAARPTAGRARDP